MQNDLLVLKKKYEVFEKIAQGGMAEVYKAVQKNGLGFVRTVAIKKILPRHVGNWQHETMFVNEAKLLVAINHPNIVKVYDLGCENGQYFFVMEFIDGCDLRKIINFFQAKGQCVPVDCAVLIALEMTKSLEYIHQWKNEQGEPQHLVHLDLSPKNILISQSGSVKLTDFGIACFGEKLLSVSPREKSGRKGKVVRGKLSYMSPEQAMGHSLDGRSDIFSLGVVLFEMLTGRPIYQVQSLDALQSAHRNQKVEAPFLGIEIPAFLEYILLRMLSFSPGDRYAGALELRQDLVKFLYHSLGTLPLQQLHFMMDEIQNSSREFIRPGESKKTGAYEETETIARVVQP